MGFATSRAQARQLVQHGHFDVNGRRTDVPAYLTQPGDQITVHAGSRAVTYFKEVVKAMEDYTAPKWMSVEPGQFAGKVLNLPSREEIDLSLNEQLIVEYYSR
jgi:small subunit ribosomal protein S4